MSPKISVIIPTFQRKQMLRQCINSLLKQSFPHAHYEIIIVDDANDSSLREYVASFSSPDKVLYYGQEHQGPAAGRNLGVQNARGEIVAFVDDDCIVDKQWLSVIDTQMKSFPEHVVVGGMIIPSTQTSAVLVSQFLSTCSIETCWQGKQEVIFFPTCNVAVRKYVFNEFQFNEKFPLPGGEDLEFFWSLFKAGYRFIWCKDMKVIHCRDDSTRSFFRQAYSYGRGNLLVQHIHGDHPLLQELACGPVSFWKALALNSIKIPYFCHSMGMKLLQFYAIKSFSKKISIYTFFLLHKLWYFVGNIIEYIRIQRGLDTITVNEANPQLLILDITHRCNFTCRICDIWKDSKRAKDLPTKYIQQVLEQAKQMGIKEIAFSGGEPLLREDIFDLIKYAQAQHIKDLGILTNGILVTRHFERLKPYFLDNTITPVISFDSLQPLIHNFIRNNGHAHQQTKTALQQLSELKQTFPHVNFNVITIILNDNYSELLDLALYIKNLGANTIQFQPLLPNNMRMAQRKASDFWVKPDQLAGLDTVIDKLVQFKKQHSPFVRNSVQNLLLMKKYYRGQIEARDVECASAKKTILISNEGMCTTCFSSYGDIRETSLQNIFRGRKISDSRKLVAKCSWPCLLPCFCDV